MSSVAVNASIKVSDLCQINLFHCHCHCHYSVSCRVSKNYALQKTLLTFYYVLLYVLLIFRDYVEICNSSVDGFTQHVSYFLLHH